MRVRAADDPPLQPPDLRWGAKSAHCPVCQTPGLIYIEIAITMILASANFSALAIDSGRWLVIHPRNLIRAKLTGPSAPPEQGAVSWQL